MRDFSELESQIHNKNIVPHFKEAVKAFHGGALRAAIIQIWITVVLDLEGKIQDLGKAGDESAKKESENFATVIKTSTAENPDYRNLVSLERDILDKAKKYKLINVRDEQVLKRIREDRNLCAHPALVSSNEVFSPTSELVRNHIAAAVDSCLSLSPIPEEILLEQLKEDLSGNSWPKPNNLPDYFARKYLNNTRKTMRSILVNKLLEYAIWPRDYCDNPEQRALRSRMCLNIIYSRGLINLLKDCLREEIAKKKNNFKDEELLRMVGAVGHFSFFAELMGESNIERIKELLSLSEINTLVECMTFASGPPEDPCLSTSYEQAFSKYIDSVDNNSLRQLIENITYSHTTIISYFIKRFTESKDSYSSTADYLSRIGLVAQYLDAKNIEELGVAFRENDTVKNSYAVLYRLRDLLKETHELKGAKQAWLEINDDIYRQLSKIKDGSVLDSYSQRNYEWAYHEFQNSLKFYYPE